MNRTLWALWAIIALAISAIVALVLVYEQQRHDSTEQQLTNLLRQQLEPYKLKLNELFDDYQRRLAEALSGFDPRVAQSLLELERSHLVGSVVVLSQQGSRAQLVYPNLDNVAPVDRSLVIDAVNWLRDSNFTERSGSRWSTWYHARGLVLSYWVRSPGQLVTMVIVPRGRWLADVVAALPDNSQARDDALLQLVDVEGGVITQWGQLELVGDLDSQASQMDSEPLPQAGSVAIARPGRYEPLGQVELALSEPLDGWRLRLIQSAAARDAALGGQARWMSWLAAAGSALALILLGLMVTLNVNRQLRQASQQVSFVNQVSHELRTPLTNIRMYTELALQGLESQAGGGQDSTAERLSIVQQEAARLGRLIENVLSFARAGRVPRPLRTERCDQPDELIDAVVATFRPQLEELEFEVQRVRGAGGPINVDRDTVEQILVNLISNALKYAAVGKLLRVESERRGEQLYVRVIDAGPGINRRLRQRIFQPFVRGSQRLEDPAGTGIGLSIARQLARQHGGDCVLEVSSSGSRFCFWISDRASE